MNLLRRFFVVSIGLATLLSFAAAHPALAGVDGITTESAYSISCSGFEMTGSTNQPWIQTVVIVDRFDNFVVNDQTNPPLRGQVFQAIGNAAPYSYNITVTYPTQPEGSQIAVLVYGTPTNSFGPFGWNTAVLVEGGCHTATTITVWGPTAHVVSWQYLDNDGHWQWVYNSDGSKVQTPIEFRDRTGSSGQLVRNYPLSRLTLTADTAPTDPKDYRVFDAVTLVPLHQVWIELGNESDPARQSVFIP